MRIKESQLEALALTNNRLNGQLFRHFIVGSTAPDLTPTVVGTGASIASVATTTAVNPGIMRFATGTTATGSASFTSGIGATGGSIPFSPNFDFRLKAVFRVPTLPNGADGFRAILGFGNSASDHGTAGAYIYLDNDDSVFWVRSQITSATQEEYGSSVVAVAGQWHSVEIFVSKTGVASFKIDNVTLANINTTAFNDANNRSGIQFSIIKRSGTASRFLDLDFYSLEWNA